MLSIQVAPLSIHHSLTKVNILYDNGANAIFINSSWIEKLKLLLFKLQHAISIFNVNKTKNSAGNSIHLMDLMIEY